MKKILIITGLLVIGGLIYSLMQPNIQFDTETEEKTVTEAVEVFTNDPSDENRMLLVLSAPSVTDSYYESAFQDIVNFQIEYARNIINKDNVIIVVDEATRSYYESLPADILLTGNLEDIWMRDFTTVNPFAPAQMIYTNASMSQEESRAVQDSFNTFANTFDIARTRTDLILDGGNVVDEYSGKIITTTRFLEDNSLDINRAKNILRSALQASQVAIIAPDEDIP